MEHLVYISYSTKDSEVTKKIVKYLEEAGVKCWMAPRDILPGIDWAKSIIDGIVTSKLMLLIFSKNSNESPQVLREVERAVNRQIPIMPFRIEEAPMSGSMEYFISSHHWFDAFDSPLETYLDDLAIKIGRVLDVPINLSTKDKGQKVEVTEKQKDDSTAASVVFEKTEPEVTPFKQETIMKEEPIKKESPKVEKPGTQQPLFEKKNSRTLLIVGVSIAVFLLAAAAAFWFIKPLNELIFPPELQAKAVPSKPADKPVIQ
ncbi:MAG: toll/interleukin-1 receptor domain-containing protein [Ignavibacteriales bacterium]|nr:toll/interleukin-1 receptor domain-containing protein [Ignavibacteriales bacterium]